MKIDNIDKTVILKLVESKTNPKYLIGYLEKVITPIVLMLPRMSGYVDTFKVKDKEKDKNNKLLSLRINEEKLLEKYKTIWTKIKDLKITGLIALPVFDDRYIKTKVRTYGDKVCTNFRDLNVPEDDIERSSFTVISIDSLLV